MHISIRNMNYAMDLKEQIIEAQLHLPAITQAGADRRVVKSTETAPSVPNTPLSPEDLEAKIDNERRFISKYKRGYRRLAEEAYGRIKYYRKRIKELKEEDEQHQDPE